MSAVRSLLRKVFTSPIRWLISVRSVPANIEAELGIDKKKPILYLIQTESITDLVALQKSTAGLGLPDPSSTISFLGEEHKRCYYLSRPQGLFTRKVKKTEIEDVFTDMFHLHRENPELDLQVVPVSISWGRSAGKESSGFAQLLADRASPSWLRKFFIVLFLGRDNIVSYSKAVSTQQMGQLHGSNQRISQKLVRVARTHFQRKRQAMSGPMLLERATLHNSLLAADSVKAAMHEEMRQKKISSEEARKKALDYIDEIAADYREGLIRIGDRILGRIWNKIYNGIHVGHAHRVRELAQNGHEIIYVPCHRSHMDYLLLTYCIYNEGLVTPHIAAGINLNFWPVGKIFRRGGAFFLRRSFAGNKLYTAVFKEYLELLFNKGYSVKYYPEGGRSRTGRLLPPKTGMLAMTLQAAVKGINRPVSIVPVYLGYEHVMEVKSYQKELKGKGKKKESPTQVFSAIRKLKNYGHGFVNFGEPLQINQFLDDTVSDWRENIPSDPDKKPSWLTPAVNKLADTIMTRINKAAALNGTALVALCLLSSKTQIMSESELTNAIADYLELLKNAPFSNDFTLPKEDAQELVQTTLALKRFEQSEDEYGKLVATKEDNAVLLTYYRNNIMHVFSLPSLIMAVVFNAKKSEKSAVLAMVEKLYPLLKREFFMHLSVEQAIEYASELIAQMKQQGLLVQNGRYLVPPAASDDGFHSSWLLSRAMQETWQRYAVVLRVLEKEKSLGRSQLEKQSCVIAERLSTLYGMSSPEFYDKNVLGSFVNALRESKLLTTLEDGTLEFSQDSLALKELINELVWPEIAQHLEKI
ncbi:glycerol-3-phosphate 1-O-acyltransferase PlsB [Glaciecola sp. MH2013]|uniref:glycerol-3-phosphate 1-O-acyltransferase PlsB n=1 Tax=Glaciecola sp. MH2013 TaxID=2785524 RepID=UPI00189C9988|nr:glycerol-3-phosphate 1-O-acyltransferase PlsB [Glaciecola sp. MH2013]MBF7074432.1 glycerol-3-phosphate 1-O-acyltransferase PlsB [Glaciecola sp. MH2013]